MHLRAKARCRFLVISWLCSAQQRADLPSRDVSEHKRVLRTLRPPAVVAPHEAHRPQELAELATLRVVARAEPRVHRPAARVAQTRIRACAQQRERALPEAMAPLDAAGELVPRLQGAGALR